MFFIRVSEPVFPVFGASIVTVWVWLAETPPVVNPWVCAPAVLTVIGPLLLLSYPGAAMPVWFDPEDGEPFRAKVWLCAPALSVVPLWVWPTLLFPVLPVWVWVSNWSA